MVKLVLERTLAALMSAALVVGLVPVVPQADALEPAGNDGLVAQATVSVASPRVVADSSMKAGQKATWDCLRFGSYPQEVVTDSSTIAALNAGNWSGNRTTMGGATLQQRRQLQ